MKSQKMKAKRAMSNLGKFAILLLLVTLLSGCGTTPGLINTGSLCKDWRIVRPTAKEIGKLSGTTNKMILDNNEARQVWGCKKLENEAA